MEEMHVDEKIESPEQHINPVDYQTLNSRFSFLKTPPFIIGLVVILLIAIGTGGYILGAKNIKTALTTKIITKPTPSPTPNLTANWLMYTDPTYGFSIKYPSDFLQPIATPATHTNETPIYTVLLRGGHVTPGATKKNNLPESWGDGFQIEIYPNPNKLSSINYIKTVAFSHDLPGWNNDKQPTKTIPLAGIDATRIEYMQGGAGGFGPVAFIADGNLMIKIVGTNPSKTNSAIFNQLITTFTLSTIPTPTSTQQSSSNKKSYFDKYFGYSIFYPNTWIFRRTYGPDIAKAAPTDILSGVDIHYQIPQTQQTQATIVINMLDGHGYTNIEKWIDSYDLNYPKNATRSNVTFAGYPALRYEQNDVSKMTYYYYFLAGKYAYRITAWETPVIRNATMDILNSFIPEK